MPWQFLLLLFFCKTTEGLLIRFAKNDLHEQPVYKIADMLNLIIQKDPEVVAAWITDTRYPNFEPAYSFLWETGLSGAFLTHVCRYPFKNASNLQVLVDVKYICFLHPGYIWQVDDSVIAKLPDQTLNYLLKANFSAYQVGPLPPNVERNFCFLMKKLTETCRPSTIWLNLVNKTFLNSNCLSYGDDRWPEYNLEPAVFVNDISIKFTLSRNYFELTVSLINLFTRIPTTDSPNEDAMRIILRMVKLDFFALTFEFRNQIGSQSPVVKGQNAMVLKAVWKAIEAIQSIWTELESKIDDDELKTIGRYIVFERSPAWLNLFIKSLRSGSPPRPGNDLYDIPLSEKQLELVVSGIAEYEFDFDFLFKTVFSRFMSEKILRPARILLLLNHHSGAYKENIVTELQKMQISRDYLDKLYHMMAL